MADRIIVTDLSAGYGSTRALNQVSLTLESGEIVALLGANGNGKSTLIKCLMGIVPLRGGSIYLEREGERFNLGELSTREIVNLGLTLVPEGRRLFSQLTVLENLELGAFRPDARRRLSENLDFCLEVFPRLRERRDQVVGSMSGGEQQMVALARAVMSHPSVLLVDEPSVGLAPILVSRVIEKIKELRDERALSVLMAEQNFNQAIKIADRGYVIVQGEIALAGMSADELQAHDLVKRYYLGDEGSS